MPSQSNHRLPAYGGLLLPALLLGAACSEMPLSYPDLPDLAQPAPPDRDLILSHDLRPPPYDFAWIEDLTARRDLADGAVPLDSAAPPDLTAPRTDLAMPVPDLAMPDLAMPVPDLAMPMPDLAMPDLAMPDLAMPDLAKPDLAMPDLYPPPDLRPAVDLTQPSVSFAAPIWLSQDADTASLVTGDFNGDGRRDIVYCNSSKGELHPLFGNGDGTFSAGAVVAVPCSWNRFDGFDFDKDGNWDVFTGAHLARGNRNGTFTVTKLSNTGAIADLDGDGNIDLVNYVNVPRFTPNVHYYTYSNGDFVDAGEAFAVGLNDPTCSGPLGLLSKGSFGCWVISLSGDLLPAYGSPGKALVKGQNGIPIGQGDPVRNYDTNLDGQPDGSGAVTRWPGQPVTFRWTGSMWGTGFPLTDWMTATFAVTDLNGDGVTDLIGTSLADQQLVIAYRAQNLQLLSSETVPFNLPVFGNAVGLADFDGDKKLDAAVAVSNWQQKTGGVLLFRGQ